MNIEHKKLFPGGLGPKTAEMGTLIWYDDNENNKLFNETLAKLRPYLRRINFRGDIDINCIVHENEAIPLEATPRFGYPAIHAQSVLNTSPWGDFLKALANGKQYTVKWRKGFCIVALVAVPPYPYQAMNCKYNPQDLKVRFANGITRDEWNYIHFSEVSRCLNNNKHEYIIAGKSGYVMCVTGLDKTVQDARENAWRIIDKIVMPKMFYRNDIGLKFIEQDQALLKKCGYL
jgi:phosphoribosylamine---glycine ligase